MIVKKKRGISKKVIYGLAVFMLFFLITVCYNITSAFRINAAGTTGDVDYSLSKFSMAAATYMNKAMSPDGGALILTGGDRSSYPGFLGYQNDDEANANSYYIGTRDSANSVTYSYQGLGTIQTTSTIYQLLSYYGKTTSTDHPAVKYDGSGNTAMGTALQEYARAGYAFAELGLDDTGDSNIPQSRRMLMGSLAIVVYVLSTSLIAFFKFALEIVEYANPFYLFLQNKSYSGTGSGTSQGIAMFLNVVAGYVKGWYTVLYNMSLYTLLPITLAFGVFMWLMSPNPNSWQTFWAKMRGYILRCVFVVVFIPAACATYGRVCQNLKSAINSNSLDGSPAMLYTFFDMESWVNDAGMEGFWTMAGNVSVVNNGTMMELNDNVAADARRYCMEYNKRSSKYSGISGSAPSISISASSFNYDRYQRSQNPKANRDIINMLQRFARGDVIGSGQYSSTWSTKINHETAILSDEWIKYDAGAILPVDTDGDGKLEDVKTLQGKIMTRLTSMPIWSSGGSGSALSVMGTYNYLNSRFTSTGVTVYSPEATSTDYAKHQHYSVTLAGNGFMKIIYYLDSIMLTACMTWLGYTYALGLMFANFQAILKIVGSVFSGLLGSMRGIAQSVAIFVSLVLNIVMTIMLFEIAYDVLDKFYVGLGSALVMIITSIVSTSNAAMFSLIVIAQAILLYYLTKKFTDWRKAIIASMTEAFTAIVNKFLGTNATAPNLQGDGSMGQKAAMLAMGAGMAAANGAFDGMEINGLTGDDATGEGDPNGVGGNMVNNSENTGEFGSKLGEGETALDENGNPIESSDLTQSAETTNDDAEKYLEENGADGEDAADKLFNNGSALEDGNGPVQGRLPGQENVFGEGGNGADDKAEGPTGLSANANVNANANADANANENGQQNPEEESANTANEDEVTDEQLDEEAQAKTSALEGDSAAGAPDASDALNPEGAATAAAAGKAGASHSNGANRLPGVSADGKTPAVRDKNGNVKKLGDAGYMEAMGQEGSQFGAVDEHGNFTSGQFNGKGRFVAGVSLPDGGFVPGLTDKETGDFRPGAYDENGEFHDGVVDSQGNIIDGSFDEDGNFTPDNPEEASDASGISFDNTGDGSAANGDIPDSFNAPEEGQHVLAMDDGTLVDYDSATDAQKAEGHEGMMIGGMYHSGHVNEDGSFSPDDKGLYAAHVYDNGSGVDMDAMNQDAVGVTSDMPEGAEYGYTTDGNDFISEADAEGLSNKDGLTRAIKTQDGQVKTGTVSADGKKFTSSARPQPKKSQGGGSSKSGGSAYGYSPNSHARPMAAQLHAVDANGQTMTDSLGRPVNAGGANALKGNGQVSYSDASGEHIGIANANGTFTDGAQYGVMTEDGFKPMSEASAQEIADGQTGVYDGTNFTAGTMDSNQIFTADSDQSNTTPDTAYDDATAAYGHGEDTISAADANEAGYTADTNAAGQSIVTDSDGNSMLGVMNEDGSVTRGAELQVQNSNGDWVPYGQASLADRQNGAARVVTANGTKVAGTVDANTMQFTPSRSATSYNGGGDHLAVGSNDIGTGTGSSYVSSDGGNISMAQSGGSVTMQDASGNEVTGVLNSDGTITAGGEAVVQLGNSYIPYASASQAQIEAGTVGVLSGGKFTAGSFNEATSEFTASASSGMVDQSGDTRSNVEIASDTSGSTVAAGMDETGGMVTAQLDDGSMATGVMTDQGTIIDGAIPVVQTSTGAYVPLASATAEQRAGGRVGIITGDGAKVMNGQVVGGAFTSGSFNEDTSTFSVDASNDSVALSAASGQAMSAGSMMSAYTVETGGAGSVSNGTTSDHIITASGDAVSGVYMGNGNAVENAEKGYVDGSGNFINRATAIAQGTDTSQMQEAIRVGGVNGAVVSGSFNTDASGVEAFTAGRVSYGSTASTAYGSGSDTVTISSADSLQSSVDGGSNGSGYADYDTLTTSSGDTLRGVANSNDTFTTDAEKVFVDTTSGQVYTRSQAQAQHLNTSNMAEGVRVGGQTGRVTLGDFSTNSSGQEVFTPQSSFNVSNAASVSAANSSGSSGGSASYDGAVSYMTSSNAVSAAGGTLSDGGSVNYDTLSVGGTTYSGIYDSNGSFTPDAVRGYTLDNGQTFISQSQAMDMGLNTASLPEAIQVGGENGQIIQGSFAPTATSGVDAFTPVVTTNATGNVASASDYYSGGGMISAATIQQQGGAVSFGGASANTDTISIRGSQSQGVYNSNGTFSTGSVKGYISSTGSFISREQAGSMDVSGLQEAVYNTATDSVTIGDFSTNASGQEVFSAMDAAVTSYSVSSSTVGGGVSNSGGGSMSIGSQIQVAGGGTSTVSSAADYYGNGSMISAGNVNSVTSGGKNVNVDTIMLPNNQAAYGVYNDNGTVSTTSVKGYVTQGGGFITREQAGSMNVSNLPEAVYDTASNTVTMGDFSTNSDGVEVFHAMDAGAPVYTTTSGGGQSAGTIQFSSGGSGSGGVISVQGNNNTGASAVYNGASGAGNSFMQFAVNGSAGGPTMQYTGSSSGGSAIYNAAAVGAGMASMLVLSSGESVGSAASYGSSATPSVSVSTVKSSIYSGSAGSGSVSYDTITLDGGQVIHGVANADGSVSNHSVKGYIYQGQFITRGYAASQHIPTAGLPTAVQTGGSGKNGTVTLGNFSQNSAGIEVFTPASTVTADAGASVSSSAPSTTAAAPAANTYHGIPGSGQVLNTGYVTPENVSAGAALQAASAIFHGADTPPPPPQIMSGYYGAPSVAGRGYSRGSRPGYYGAPQTQYQYYTQSAPMMAQTQTYAGAVYANAYRTVMKAKAVHDVFNGNLGAAVMDYTVSEMIPPTGTVGTVPFGVPPMMTMPNFTNGSKSSADTLSTEYQTSQSGYSTQTRSTTQRRKPRPGYAKKKTDPINKGGSMGEGLHVYGSDGTNKNIGTGTQQ